MTGRDGRFLHQSRIKTLGANGADYAALILLGVEPCPAVRGYEPPSQALRQSPKDLERTEWGDTSNTSNRLTLHFAFYSEILLLDWAFLQQELSNGRIFGQADRALISV